uniref:Uncharacterized protein n=1 Tax=Schistocephalus solidus TaxID=70667 RepID=A0A0X3P7J5_SCHSO
MPAYITFQPPPLIWLTGSPPSATTRSPSCAKILPQWYFCWGKLAFVNLSADYLPIPCSQLVVSYLVYFLSFFPFRFHLVEPAPQLCKFANHRFRALHTSADYILHLLKIPSLYVQQRAPLRFSPLVAQLAHIFYCSATLTHTERTRIELTFIFQSESLILIPAFISRASSNWPL